MNIKPYDAWVIARLLCGEHVNGEMDAASEPVKRIGKRLIDLPLEGRNGAFEGGLASLKDGNAVFLAVADQDPQAPPPPIETTGEGDKTRCVVMRRASDIEPLTVEWLWRDRLPLGMLSMFAGDPKQGKSFVTVALAAAISRGAPLPHGDVPEGPRSVVLLSAEDDAARTIVPRLKSAGAILSRVHILEAVKLPNGSETLPSLAADIDRIAEAVERLGDCRLVVIDPITAYLGGVDDHRNAELRGVLSPLKAMAERLNVAVVLVTHLNKGAGTNGKHRVTGSIAYVGACRANFLFARDREDQSGRTVLMLANGCNLAGDIPTLAYRIEDRGEGPAIEWNAEPVPITADEALQADLEDHREHDREEARECDEWLRDALASGRVDAKGLIAIGRSIGFSEDQLKRAKKKDWSNLDSGRKPNGSGLVLVASRRFFRPRRGSRCRVATFKGRGFSSKSAKGAAPCTLAPFAPFGNSVRPSRKPEPAPPCFPIPEKTTKHDNTNR